MMFLIALLMSTAACKNVETVSPAESIGGEAVESVKEDQPLDENEIETGDAADFTGNEEKSETEDEPGTENEDEMGVETVDEQSAQTAASYELPIGNEEALPDQNEYLGKICETAAKLKTGVVATALTRGANKPQNSAFVIDKTGTVLMKYSKVHTCDFADEKCLESGSKFKVCDFHGVKIGIMICYDREYPESARMLMLKGAELILVPNDCGAMKPRVQVLSTRAYEGLLDGRIGYPFIREGQ